jgi:hypothetical protein
VPSDMVSAMSISSHSYTHRRRRSPNGEPSVPHPLDGRVRLTRRQAKEKIHTWDQQIMRLGHRVEKLEEQNEKLRDFLTEAVRICDEAIAAGRRRPPVPSRVANMYHFLLFHSVSLRSQLQLPWRRLLTVTHLSLPHRREMSPPVGWPFEPVLDGLASVGSEAHPGSADCGR